MKRKRSKRFLQWAISSILTVTMIIGGLSILPAKEAAAAKATLTVDMTDKTGDILHGAAGFLYGVSNEDVPTTNTMVPLKPKVLATKGALGTEHPYGDALDVAKTFLESGGQQVQMYNSNYYGVFGVTAKYTDYAEVLETIIAPAVLEWKEAWKADHGTPEAPYDNIGAQINIDEAIVYIPINEGTPINGANFNVAWKAYYDAIKKADPNAWIAGPNSDGYGTQFGTISHQSHFQYCIDNDCMPDVITWHELQRSDLRDMKDHMNDFRNLWDSLNWGSKTPQEMPQIVINEYAEMIDCGVPGRLVNWIARLEDEKLYGCLPFWHQANNLNDLTADANEGNGAWWVYKWYGDMSGQTLGVETNTNYDALYGVASIDDNKQVSTILTGGVDGEADIILKDIDRTATFEDAAQVHVEVQSTNFTGFHGAQQKIPTEFEGVYPVDSDGSVTVPLTNMKFSTAYRIVVTKAAADEMVEEPFVMAYRNIYEAENAILENGAVLKGQMDSDLYPEYYFSGGRAVRMPQNASLTYTIDIPTDGKYRLEYIYGNGEGSDRNNMDTHKPVNLVQSYSLDGGGAEDVTMKSTLLQNMSGMNVQYADMKAGRHKIKITTIDPGSIIHDVLNVYWAGAYKDSVPAEDLIYEAEQSDFNMLKGFTDTTVKTETALAGYSGNGYVKGLSRRPVTEGGGIRWNVILEESGLYNVTLHYQSKEAGTANIYIGNTALTLDHLVKKINVTNTNGKWYDAAATVYLQKGINIIDLDATKDIELDYMRVQEIPEELLTGSAASAVIDAVDCIPQGSGIQTRESAGSSGGSYVVGIRGSENAVFENDGYLEIEYNAPSAGVYQMQVFQSNDEICGSHSYNTKIIDKYASFEVNGDTQNAKRYFFINSFSNDTFKEKSIPLYLKAGKNIIKVYNDDSWHVLWGGSKNTPGTNELVNYTPNFDQFIITPEALPEPVVLPVEYGIHITTTAGGYVSVDKNKVGRYGTFNLKLTPEKGIYSILVNGVPVEATENKNGTYSLKIENVQKDIEVVARFMESEGGSGPVVPSSDLKSLQITPLIATYVAGTEIDPDGQTIMAQYEDGTEKEITVFDCDVNGFDTRTTGQKTVTLSYVDNGISKSGSFTITVAAAALDSIRVDQLPTKTAYQKGDKFDYEGVLIKAAYTNRPEKIIIPEECRFSGFDSTSPGDKTITVSYTESSVTKTCSFTVRILGEVTRYSVTLNANGGKIGNVTQQSILLEAGKAIGTVINPLPTPTRTGYNFKGWFTTSAGTGGTKVTTSTIVNGNMTVHARWAEKTVKSVNLNKKKLTLGVKEKFQLKANVLPSDAANKTLKWKSSSTKNVTVTGKGKVTAKKAGTATITATANNRKKITCKVTVKAAPKKISLNAETKIIKKGKVFKIKVKLPKNTASNKITYQSSNKSVATVSASGKVKALKKGTVTITVKTFNGKKAKLKVTVNG